MRRWVIIGAVAFGGCAHFESRPIAPSETAARFEQRTLDQPGLKKFLETNLRRDFSAWPTPTWDYEMLTLAAFYYHPSLEVARAQWRVSQAGIRTAGARPNPTLNTTAAYDAQIPGNFSPWLPMFTLDVPVETAGKRQRRLEQAQHLSASARFNIATTAWQVRSELRSAVLERGSAQQRIELLEKQTRLQEKMIQKLDQQFQAGAISIAELAPARVALARARADLTDAQSQFVGSRVRVATAIGMPVSALDGVTVHFDLAQTPATTGLTSAAARRAALQGRADILGALADYAATQSALQLEIARQYPDVHLSPGYAWNQGNAGDNQWALGLSLELPVLNHNQGPIAEAEGRRAEVAARFLALQAKVIGEIDSAIAVLDANRINLTALQSLADAQQARRESIEAQFQAGAAEQLDLLGAQLEFNTTALAQLDAQVKFHQSLGALEDAVQRPLEANTAPPADVTASAPIK